MYNFQVFAENKGYKCCACGDADENGWFRDKQNT